MPSNKLSSNKAAGVTVATVGGPVDIRELRRAEDEKAMQAAMVRAKTIQCIAYPVSRMSGLYGVPSNSDIGTLYLAMVSPDSGQGLWCLCEGWVRFQKWCVHLGAARNTWMSLKEIDDREIEAKSIERLNELRDERNDD